MEEKVLKQRGGKREGAGRKKTLPDGARMRTFALDDEEMARVRKYIIAMRKEKRENQQVENAVPTFTMRQMQDTVFGMIVGANKAIAKSLIDLNGGAPYEGIENLLKDAAIIGFKDAVSEYERHRRAK